MKSLFMLNIATMFYFIIFILYSLLSCLLSRLQFWVISLIIFLLVIQFVQLIHSYHVTSVVITEHIHTKVSILPPSEARRHFCRPWMCEEKGQKDFEAFVVVVLVVLSYKALSTSLSL